MRTRIPPGVDVARAERQLRLIGEIVAMAAELEVQVWLRGGWAVDFFLGEVTRDHVDIDWFAWAADAVALEGWLLRHGYQRVGSAPVEQQLDVVRDGLELSFAWLARDGSQVVVTGGLWAGQPWPLGMLDAAPGRIGRLVCPIVGPAAQIEIKQMMPVWVPGRPRRAKEAEDIARLQAALLRRDAEPTWALELLRANAIRARIEHVDEERSELSEDLEAMPPGPQLAALLASIDRQQLSETDRVRLVQARNRLVSHQQAELLVDIYALCQDETPEFSSEHTSRFPWTEAELAFALRWTRVAAGYRLEQARQLIEDFPVVQAALTAGVIDPPNVRSR